MLDDLIHRDSVAVVEIGATGKHGLIAEVGKCLCVVGGGQPHAPIPAFVEQIPDAPFAPHCRRAARTFGNRLACGEADIERPLLLPVDAIDGY